MGWLARLWPASLSTRIAFILIAGLVLAQVMTSTIWFESRRRQMLEIPTRVFAARVADTLRVLDTGPLENDRAVLARLQAPGFDLRLTDRLPERASKAQDLPRTAEVLKSVIVLHLGRPADVRVLDAQLLDDRERPADSWAMMTAGQPTARFLVAARLSPSDPWLLAEGGEDENGADFRRTETILDYVLRIYLLRILIVAVLTWWAVRLAMTPLKRMANAAEQLEANIYSPPLDTHGPREVRCAAEAFNAMQAKMIAHVEERTRLLAAVSHDLRSPITRLRLRTELLRDDSLKAVFRRDLGEMEEMVDATLSFVKSGVEESVRAPVDLDEMLASMVEDMVGQGRAVSLFGAVGHPVVCFPQSLRRCVLNLLENAVRYGGPTEVVVSGDAHEICICVRDRGAGIPDDQIEMVFEPFFRLEASRNTASGGVGLGLSIARNIAHAHDGELSLHNRSGGGLEARLCIPQPG